MTIPTTPGYRLDVTGEPTADVICPHGKAIDQINHRNYALNYHDDPAVVTAADLDTWLAENRDNLEDYCMGHRP